MNITILQSDHSADITVFASEPADESLLAELTRWGLTIDEPSPATDVYLLAHHLWQFADDVRITTERDLEIEKQARHVALCHLPRCEDRAHDDDHADDALFYWRERLDSLLPTPRVRDATPEMVTTAQANVRIAIFDENNVLPDGTRFHSHRIDIHLRGLPDSYYLTDEFVRDSGIAFEHVAQVFANLQDTAIQRITWGDATDLYAARTELERLGWSVSIY